MKLREFKQEDAKIIAGWLRTEDELYRWSADRFNKYPLSGEDINESYGPQKESGRFFPLTADIRERMMTTWYASALLSWILP